MKRKLCLIAVCLCLILGACSSSQTSVRVDPDTGETITIQHSASALCNHTWLGPSCTEGRFCRLCGKEDGVPLGHSFTDATCVEARHCTECGYSDGEVAGHTYQNKVCVVCGKVKPSDPEDIRKALQDCERYMSYNTYNYTLIHLGLKRYNEFGSHEGLMDASDCTTKTIENFTAIINICKQYPELDLIMKEFEDFRFGIDSPPGSITSMLEYSSKVNAAKIKSVTAVYRALCEIYGVETDVTLED